MHPRGMGRLLELAPRVSQGSKPLVQAQSPMGLHLQNPRSKIKLSISRQQLQSIKPQALSSAEHGTLCDCTSYICQ